MVPARDPSGTTPPQPALSRCCARRFVPAGGRSQNLVDGLQQHLQDASVVHFLSCRPLRVTRGDTWCQLPESDQHTCPDRPIRWGLNKGVGFSPEEGDTPRSNPPSRTPGGGRPSSGKTAVEGRENSGLQSPACSPQRGSVGRVRHHSCLVFSPKVTRSELKPWPARGAWDGEIARRGPSTVLLLLLLLLLLDVVGLFLLVVVGYSSLLLVVLGSCRILLHVDCWSAVVGCCWLLFDVVGCWWLVVGWMLVVGGGSGWWVVGGGWWVVVVVVGGGWWWVVVLGGSWLLLTACMTRSCAPCSQLYTVHISTGRVGVVVGCGGYFGR